MEFVEDILGWVQNDAPVPRTVVDANFVSTRLLTLRSRLSAAYKGTNVLVLRDGSRDFFWKATIQELDFEEVALDIHHIFPKAWCEERGIKPALFNSIINKTPISYKANRMIGGRAPSAYLVAIQGHKQVGLSDKQMDLILDTHLIDPHYLRTDDFETFCRARGKRLLEMIERSMGKSVHQSVDGADESSETDHRDMEVA
jgi:hypothetical protein